MKSVRHFMFLFAAATMTLVATSCHNQPAPSAVAGTAAVPKDTVKTESDLLLDYLVKTGDYVNSRQFPSMIKAPTVYENLGKNMLVVDLREADYFRKGHIKGAVNVKFSSLPDYFRKDIKPFQYSKIVLVCEHGQQSSYATCLLRLMGYGNVYSMRWGMTAWNPSLAAEKGWSKLVNDKYADKLDTSTALKPEPGQLPVLHTGKKTGEEILMDRVNTLFHEDFRKVMLGADDVFGGKDSLFIINYDRKDKYESGHIPGAVRYKPNATLGIVPEMLTIPSSKNVVVYCETGHNSAFVTAYLRLFGYDAHSLRMGNNGFMYNRMKNQPALAWTLFTPEQLNNFPIVK